MFESWVSSVKALVATIASMNLFGYVGTYPSEQLIPKEIRTPVCVASFYIYAFEIRCT